MRRLIVLVLSFAVVAAGGYAAWWGLLALERRGGRPIASPTLDRGAIMASVRATGTLNPVTTVLVGSQLSGQIVDILVDYNSPVKAGQVLARLYSDQIKTRRDAAAADLAQRRAELRRSAPSSTRPRRRATAPTPRCATSAPSATARRHSSPR